MHANGETRVVSAQVDRKTAETLEQIALEHERTLSGEIRLALREHLSRQARVQHVPDERKAAA